MRLISTVFFAATIAFCLQLAACDSERAPLASRQQDQPPTDEIADAVRTNLVDADFAEPEAEGLHLDRRGNLLFVKGVVSGNSHDQMYDALKDAPEVAVVVLTSVPGSADDETNVELGRMIRRAGMTTYLPAGGLVASGGTDLLLSGARRVVERGAEVGVHSWASGDGVSGDSVPRNDPQHKLFLDYYRDIGIAEEFYWFTLSAAPADSMHWMSEDEMAQYAVYTELR